MDRREFLGATVGLCSSLAGCISDPSLGASTATVTRQTPYVGLVRCRGDPVTVEETYTDPAGYEDDLEYFPENKTIRYVAATSGGEPALFNTQSFEEWGSIECASIGAKRVREATTSRLGTDEFSIGIGAPDTESGASSSDGLVIRISLTTWHQEDGSVRTPPVPLARLANVAPRTANATVTIEGDTFSRAVPVFASHSRGSEV